MTVLRDGPAGCRYMEVIQQADLLCLSVAFASTGFARAAQHNEKLPSLYACAVLSTRRRYARAVRCTLRFKPAQRARTIDSSDASAAILA